MPIITQLAEEYEVSVGSIREAVKALESLGMIRIEHGRGMFVTLTQPLTSTPFDHFQDVGSGSILALCEARRILEPELALFAAERGTTDQLEAIRASAQETVASCPPC